MINKNKLPKVLADLLSAQEKFDSESFVKTFADNAVVHDEGVNIADKKQSANGMRQRIKSIKPKWSPLLSKRKARKAF